jgi:pimeloyl-ACP methyl ester carboxylesterase/DNA-binding CsgD family transcriptional regulator
MDKDNNFLYKSVQEVFSLVPTDEAINSSREVVSRYIRNDASITSSIKWAEFEFNGLFVRGGISNVDSMSSRLISTPQEDSIIAEIVEYTNASALKVGQLAPTLNNNGFYWCVPFTPQNNTDVPKMRHRTILITEGLFLEILELFNTDANLTKAESRMIYQLIIGLNPTEAAKADQVSIETKRSQLKKATAKLNCSGQVEIVRLMMGQLIHIIYLCEAEISHMQMTEQFSSKFLGSDFKLSVQRLSNKRLMRYWELGPTNGAPLLVIHGCLFPILLLNAKEYLNQYNIRLIIPIRAGYLDEQVCSDIYHKGQLVDQTIEDLSLFIRQTCNAPIPVIGHATGGFFAMLMAKMDADLFSTIIIPSINFMEIKPESRSFSSNFFGGIRKLTHETGIYENLVRQFQKTAFSNDHSTKFVLRRLFKSCKSDVKVLDGDIGSGECFSWYRALHAKSVLGISSDFRLVSSLKDNLLNEVPKDIPVTFIHGSNDTFSNPHILKNYAADSPSATVNVLEDGGHLVAASHPDLIWSAINNSIMEISAEFVH